MYRLRRWLFVVVLVAAPAWLSPLVASPAGAHAELERGEPAPNASLPASPGRIRLVLTEPPSTLSQLSLTGPDGKRADLGPTRVAGDALEASVGYLEPGTYTVRWGTFSDEDGHLVGGSYRFQVGPGRLAEVGGTGPALDRTLSIGSRLLLLAGAILWAGSLLLGWLLAPSAPEYPVLATFDTRLRRVTGWAVLTTLVLGELANLAAAARSGLPVGTGDFFFGSTTGQLLTARICVLAAGLGLSGWPRRGGQDRRTQLALAVGYLGLLAFSGHARLAPAGPLSGPLFDGIHLLGASAWLGGIVLLGLGLPAATAGGGLAEAARRFSPVALAAAATLGITGIFATDQQLLSASDLSDSAYGRLLVIKLVLVAALVAMSAQVGFVLRPRLLGEAPGTGPGAVVASRLLRNLRAEAVVAAGIVACVALMTSRASPQVVAAGAVRGGGRAPDPGPVLARQEVGDRQVALSIVPGVRGRNRVIVSVDGEAVPNLRLRVDGPERAGPALRLPVVDGASTAEVDIPSAGDWRARVTVAGKEVDFSFTVGEPVRPGGGFQVLSVADLQGPGREGCRQEILGRQVALSGSDKPPVYLVVDAGDFEANRIPGSPDVVLGGCGIDDGRLAELARERQIPLVGSDTVAGGPWSWRLAPDPTVEGQTLARLSRETPGVASAAVAFEGAEGSAAAVAFADRFSALGGTVAGTWDLGSSPPEAVASQMVPLRVDLLVLFGSPKGTTALAHDLDGRGWRPGRTVLGASSFFGPELLDAAPGWTRQGITNVAGYHELDVKMVSPYVRGLLGAFPGELPTLRGFAGFLEGRLLLDAMARVQGRPGREQLVGALDGGFRRGWRPGAIDIAWQPGDHNGAGEVALFQLTPTLNMFGLLGGTHSGHEIGGLLYTGGDLQRITSFAGPAGPVRSEGGDPGP
jgi:copper transport protein